MDHDGCQNVDSFCSESFYIVYNELSLNLNLTNFLFIGSDLFNTRRLMYNRAVINFLYLLNSKWSDECIDDFTIKSGKFYLKPVFAKIDFFVLL